MTRMLTESIWLALSTKHVDADSNVHKVLKLKQITSSYTAMQSQKVVSAYFTSEQILRFDFAERFAEQYPTGLRFKKNIARSY